MLLHVRNRGLSALGLRKMRVVPVRVSQSVRLPLEAILIKRHDHASRDTSDHTVWRDVARNNCSSTYDDVVANRHAGKDRDVCSGEDVVANFHVASPRLQYPMVGLNKDREAVVVSENGEWTHELAVASYGNPVYSNRIYSRRGWVEEVYIVANGRAVPPQPSYVRIGRSPVAQKNRSGELSERHLSSKSTAMRFPSMRIAKHSPRCTQHPTACRVGTLRHLTAPHTVLRYWLWVECARARGTGFGHELASASESANRTINLPGDPSALDTRSGLMLRSIGDPAMGIRRAQHGGRSATQAYSVWRDGMNYGHRLRYEGPS